MELQGRDFFYCVQVIVLLGLVSSFAGCVGDGASADVRDELAVATQEDEHYDDDDDGGGATLTSGESQGAENDSSSLAGTCPFGNHCCGSPGCSLWTDLNEDGCCDLGVVAE